MEDYQRGNPGTLSYRSWAGVRPGGMRGHLPTRAKWVVQGRSKWVRLDISETAASCEVANRGMSLEDMSGLLFGMPAGTSPSAQMANTNVDSAGGRLNKTPLYVPGFTDTRGFLICLWVLCTSGLSARIKRERLIVQRTAIGFRTTVSALRCFEGSKSVTFHISSFPENCFVLLLVKNLGKQMLTASSGRSWKLLVFVYRVLQLRSRRRDKDASKY
jgi:hypothetical protein